MRSFFATVFFLSSFSLYAVEVPIGIASNFSEVSLSTSNPYGDYFRKGVELAVQDSSEALSKKKIQIKFTEFDYGTNQVKVMEAARKAVASDVIAVLGYNFSSHALLAGPIHQTAKLPMITPSATANRIDDIGSYVHMASFTNSFMGQGLANFALTELKAKSAAIVVNAECAYCNDLALAFENQFRSKGGTLTYQIQTLENDKDFSSPIAQLKKRPVDVILVPNYELPSTRIVAALKDAGIDGPFLGGDGWGDVGEEFYKVLGKRTVKAFSVSHWHPDLKTKRSLDFKKKFFKKYKVEPNDTAVLAYDSMKLLIQAILDSKSYTRDAINDSIARIKEYSGVTGEFRYPNAASAPSKSMVLLTAGPTRFQIYKVIPYRKGG